MDTTSFLTGITSHTIIAVAQGATAGGNVIWADSNASVVNFLMRQGASNQHIWQNPLGNIGFAGFTSGLAIDVVSHDGANNALIYSPRDAFRRNVDDLSVYANIARVGSMALTGAFHVGAIGGGGAPWLGEGKEWLVFAPMLTPEELGQVLDYLAWEYNLANNRPFILCIGDSITGGQGVAIGQNYPRRLAAALAGVATVDTSAYSGRTPAQMIAEYDIDCKWRSWRAASKGNQVAIIMATNGIAGAGTVAADQTNLEALSNKLRRDDYYIIYVPPTPRNEAGYNAKRDQITAWARARTPILFDAVTTLDTSAVGVAGAQNNGTLYQVDAIHTTAEGDRLIFENTLPFVLAGLSTGGIYRGGPLRHVAASMGRFARA
jgi:lysophospholipase L1-like esterase